MRGVQAAPGFASDPHRGFAAAVPGEVAAASFTRRGGRDLDLEPATSPGVARCTEGFAERHGLHLLPFSFGHWQRLGMHGSTEDR